MRQSKALVGSILFVLIMLLSFCLFVSGSSAADPVVLWVDPSTQTVGLQETFNVTIQVGNLPSPDGACGYEILLGWDPAILTGIDVTDVLFHSVMPESEWDNIWKIKSEINNTGVWFAFSFQDVPRALDGGYAPISGNHTLAVVTLMGASTGTSALRFLKTLIGDEYGSRIENIHSVGGSVVVGNPPPIITIVSPQNTTYSTTSVNLTVALSEPASWIGYSLDDDTNVTVTGNIFVPASNGPHTLVVYANDTTGEMGVSEKVYFTVDAEPPVASFTYSPQTPEAKLVFGTFIWNFTFDASASYDTVSSIATYFWEFGDGTNATGVTAIHHYRQSGTYDVTLNVTDQAGNKAIQTKTITINPAPEPLDVTFGLLAAIVIPVVWVPALWFYLARVRRKTKKT